MSWRWRAGRGRGSRVQSPENRLDNIERRLPPPPAAPLPHPAVPNIIDFVVGPNYLDRPLLYPRQGTTLKLWALADDLFTGFDEEVIDEWRNGFRLEELGAEGGVYRGGYGVAPDILERLALCKAQGRGHFRHKVDIGGRRGSKGYLGSICVAYCLWRFMATVDPAERYGIAEGRTIAVQIFAGNKVQSRDVFWRDLSDLLRTAPCFAPYIAGRHVDRISLWSPAQVDRGAPDGVGFPAFEIVAREATENAGRGHTAAVTVHDEMAHGTGPELFEAATGALIQFGIDAFTLMPSSPRHQTGQLYRSYQQGLSVDAEGRPLNHQIMVSQFPSWELYRDWERAAEIPLYPGGPTSAPIRRAIVAEDDVDLDQIKRTNPEMFRVEFEAQWAEVTDAYLRRDLVEAMFLPWGDPPITMQERASALSNRYVAHCDLSLVGDNTAIVIGHNVVDEAAEEGTKPDIIIDLIRVLRPSDFHDGIIDYDYVEAELRRYLAAFRLERLTFDAFNSAAMIRHLLDYAHELGRHPAIQVVHPSHTHNRMVAEQLKVTLYEGRIHSPFDQLAHDELLFLRDDGFRVDHPSTGPCTSKDVADALMEVVTALNEMELDPGHRFRSTGLIGHRMSQDEIFDQLGNLGLRHPGQDLKRLSGGTTAPRRRRPPRRRG